MGATLADVNRRIYARGIANGKTHDEIIKDIPKKHREDFERSINMSGIEAHFGMKPKWFFLSLGIVIIGTIIFGLIVG